jgi:hypothetical protein
MENFRGLVPILSCAILIGIRWYRATDIDTKIYHIKKKHWYAGFESIMLMASIAVIFKGIQ